MLSGDDAAHILRFQSFLLDDAGRLDTWEAAISKVVKPGDVVLDLGSGMGILSLMACRAGAEKVYAVERSRSADLARLVAADNDLEDKVVVLEGLSQEIELDEPADVLVTDTTETLGLNGQLLSSVLDARERLLRPDARLIPKRLELRLAPVEAPKAYRYLVDVWGPETRGFDLSALRPFAVNNKHPGHFKPDAFLAEPAGLGWIDLARLEEPAFHGAAGLTATRAGTLHGLGGFFAAELAEGVTLSNDPREATVGYAQGLLPLTEPQDIQAGDALNVSVDTYDGREWSWRVELRREGEAKPEVRAQATLHGFPRTREELLGGLSPKVPGN